MNPCEEVLLKIHAVLEDEDKTEIFTEIAEHLDACPPCDDHYHVQSVIKKVVYRSCHDEAAPQALYESIVVRLQSMNTE